MSRKLEDLVSLDAEDYEDLMYSDAREKFLSTAFVPSKVTRLPASGARALGKMSPGMKAARPKGQIQGGQRPSGRGQSPLQPGWRRKAA